MNEKKYIKIYNFDEIEKSGKNYGGMSGSKLGIKLNGENWILKFPKSTKNMNNVKISYMTTPLSEYIGSHIYESIGILVHETVLGIKDEKVVVACKDFLKNNETLEEFRETKNEYIKGLEEKIDSLSVSGIPTDINIEVIDIVMNNNTIFLENPSLKEHFWDMFVVDTFIGNNDRNNGNWGIIKDSNSNVFLYIAPVYDNGAAFYNKKSEEEIQNLLNDDKKFQNTVINSMRCPFSKNGKEINPRKYILSLENENLNQAILRIVPKINLDNIKEIINEIPNIDNRTGIKVTSDIQKEFYCKILKSRYEEILLPAYEELYSRDLEDLLNNIENELDDINWKLSKNTLKEKIEDVFNYNINSFLEENEKQIDKFLEIIPDTYKDENLDNIQILYDFLCDKVTDKFGTIEDLIKEKSEEEEGEEM